MKGLRIPTVVAVFAMVLAGRVAGDPAPKAEPIAVIVGRDSKVAGLSSNELKRVFTGENLTGGGSGKLVPFNQNPSSVPRVAFDRAVLVMTPGEVGRFWVDRKVRGQTGAPRALASSAQVVKVVAKFPNAIGYVPIGEVTGDVKVIAVDGARPGDDDYTLWTK
jgi:ABC-type phosphate transport system substrate-binding protein